MVGFVVSRHVDDCRRAFRVGVCERERDSRCSADIVLLFSK